MHGGSLSLKQLRDRGFDDAKIAEMGGIIQGRNVVFKDKIGGFNSVGEIIKLPPKPKPPSIDQWMKDNGAKLWGELHRWALTLDPPQITAWLERFAQRLPCGICKQHWREMVKATPPPKDDTLFAWTVDRHNEVNERLGKPLLTVDEARQIWKTV